jgi:hypothetical protein
METDLLEDTNGDTIKTGLQKTRLDIVNFIELPYGSGIYFCIAVRGGELLVSNARKMPVVSR